MLVGWCLMIPLVFAQDATTAPATSPSTAPAVAASVNVNPRPRAQFLQMLGPVFENTPLMGWLVLLIAIALGLAGIRLLQSILKDIARRLEQRHWNISAEILRYAIGPGGLVILALALGIGMQGVVLEDQELLDLVQRVLGLFYIVALAWFLFNLVDLLDLALRKITQAAGAPTLDETVLTLLRKTLRVFLLILFALFVAQNTFNANISAWLAGLGIAGLAVSLAAQDSVKNLFGSMAVLIERPFSIGDRIIFGTYDGTVETIGFRSTKIRTMGGNLVTVPNMKFTDGIVENISARPYLSRAFNLTLVAATPPEKIKRALEIVRGILDDSRLAEAFDMAQRPPRVYFNQINADSLNINVNYWYDITAANRDPWTFQEHAEEINLRIIKAFADAGIELSLPTYQVALSGEAERPDSSTQTKGHQTGKTPAN